MFQHTFNTFVGGKLLGPTFLGSPTVRLLVLELLSLFCCGNFVGPTDFGSPTVKTVGFLELLWRLLTLLLELLSSLL